MWRNIDRVAWLTLALIMLAPVGALAQSPDTGGPPLEARLPATVGGAPVKVTYSQDLQAWLDEVYAGQSHPEIDALEAALAAQGLSFADVAIVSADFGPDGLGVIQGFGIPGGDPAGLQDAIVDAYFLGMGEMERTERDVGDHSVTFLSEGPLDAADYPFAVLPDTGVLWIVAAELSQILDALAAILAVAAGTATGNTTTAPTPEPAIGPAEWSGTMRGTTTWDKGKYQGTATATFTGSWILPELSTTHYCDSDCVAYIPAGTVDWRWESAAPGPPSCSINVSGSVPAGDTIVPQDQMLYLARSEADHLSYWESGTVFLPPQDCVGWESSTSPDSFFEISMPSQGDPFADRCQPCGRAAQA